MEAKTEKSVWADRLGPLGIWSAELRFGDKARSLEAAEELDALGYRALWTPGGIGGDILETMDRLAQAAPSIVVASAIINIWKHEPEELGAWWRRKSQAQRDRRLLGLGVSHGPLIGEAYVRPLAKMAAYLEALNSEGIDPQHLCVAAFGPKMLALSGERSAGAHPYLVTPDHTAAARALLGPGALLAPGQAVTLETNPARAREIARGALSVYLPMPNYIASWRRQGFRDEDIATASDRLCDAMVAWGEPEVVATRVRAHLAAGANHVCIKVVRGAPGGDATELLPAWRALARALS